MAYTSASDVVNGHDLLGAAHIQSGWLDAADQEIDNRTGRGWALRTGETIDAPGTGQRWIDLDVDKIVSLSAVSMGDVNNSDLETLTADDYTIKDGFVWLKTTWASNNFRGFDDDQPIWIESDIDNCHFTGNFEEATPEIIKTIAKLIVLRYAQGYHTERFNWDAVRQMTANAGYTQEGKLSLDDAITHLIDHCLDSHIKNVMVFV